jgi:site-specific recombinase XerD
VCGARCRHQHTEGKTAQPTPDPAPAQLVVFSRAGADLGHLATRYLHEEVFGVQAKATFEAKAHDLERFLTWLQIANGAHAVWVKQDTVDFLKELERQGRAAATINRALATLKAFATWIYAQPKNMLLDYGMPTVGVGGKSLDPPSCRKLSDVDVRRLVRAASMLIRTRTHKNQRPWRDRAIFTVLLHTGLRVSEMVRLTLGQYTGKSFLRVRRKGRAETPIVHVPTDCRSTIDEYLTQERVRDEAVPHASQPLFLATGTDAGQALHRCHINRLLDIIACEAHKNHPESPLSVHPHQLRHTFGAKHREAWGSDTETAAALGHTGIQHVGRYTRKTDDERAAMVEGLF